MLARTGKHGNWPRPERAYRHARESCQDVVRGWAPTYVARMAFEEAVKEAGLHLHF
ncbi:DUF982 domain-containing protein [Rhizobium sp. BT03]|uniref:DUF982 domain-containing protein n=1 Tax=Rhizobium sp. BT03 TaxID=3045156 RepID=UPI0024B3CC3D|nr:DUF982 domain-containing protein [Rhizobium sp. BT03]WHO73757.1 DUF982 domain-containing protein [Rhizobium sp. BT03]